MILHTYIPTPPLPLPCNNFQQFTVSRIKPRQAFRSKGYYCQRSKVISRLCQDIVNLHLSPSPLLHTYIPTPPLPLPCNNFQQFTVSRIKPRQAFRSKGYYCQKSKVISRLCQDIVNLHLSPSANTSISARYQFPDLSNSAQ